MAVSERKWQSRVRRFSWRERLTQSTLRSQEHTSELQSLAYLVCRLLLEKKNIRARWHTYHFDSFLLSFHLCHHMSYIFFFNDTATTEIYTLSLHDALPIFNDLTDPETLAHLLSHDTAYGRFRKKVAIEGATLLVEGAAYPVYAEIARAHV